ncbi:MAG: cobalamin adenosyltransferase [Elusimicrobiota bacterium]|jgi:ethanolamine utilization cobalamin adenosyltransferase|nr:cobalamin adenosyltransferase [Elusimicrobiota bacterium]
MRPITEQDIKNIIKRKEDIKSVSIPLDSILTPAAAELLKMRSIAVEYSKDAQFSDCLDMKEAKINKGGAENSNEQNKKKRQFLSPSGEVLDEKPESMTHLYGNQLVCKDHPIIIWRGKLDILVAEIIEAQSLGMQKNNSAFVNDLQEILSFIRHLLPCEYRKEPLGEDFKILGLSSNDLRERSHNPFKYYGHRHILAESKMGALSVRLNLLRARSRETELAAITAFKDANGDITRNDIIEALNRLSSLFYILTYKYLPKNFISSSAGI